MPDVCPSCSGRRLDTRGLGTQQVEAAVVARFPEARIERMDLDTTGPKWSHARLYRAMQGREIDILVGTQMIAKGFDLPGVAVWWVGGSIVLHCQFDEEAALAAIDREKVTCAWFAPMMVGHLELHA